MTALEARAPESLPLAEARGLFEIYAQRCGPARTYLARAVALGGANPAVLRAYAKIMPPSDPEPHNALLTQAGTVAPDEIRGIIHFVQLSCTGGGTGTR